MKMPPLIFSSVIFMVLLVQCGGTGHIQRARTVKIKREPAPISSQANVNASGNEAAQSKCDFSAYEPMRISHFYPRMVVQGVRPTYPREALQQGLEGRVMVKVLVNSTGDVEKACAAGGANVLQKAAESAALQWKFKQNFGFSHVPQRRQGANNYVIDILPFHFTLNTDDTDVGIIVSPLN